MEDVREEDNSYNPENFDLELFRQRSLTTVSPNPEFSTRALIHADAEIKYNINTITPSLDYDNNINKRHYFHGAAAKLYSGWMRIESGPHRQEIGWCFPITVAHISELVWPNDPTPKTRGASAICYIIEDVNRALNVQLDTTIPSCSTYPPEVVEEKFSDLLATKMPVLARDFNKNFDFRAAMFILGQATGKVYSTHSKPGFSILNWLGAAFTFEKESAEAVSLGLHTMVVNSAFGTSGLALALTTRIIARAGIDKGWGYGVTMTGLQENTDYKSVLTALQYFRDNIMYTANLTGSSTEHWLAFAQGLHSVWSLHGHTDEGGWVRRIHANPVYPPIQGYLLKSPETAIVDQVTSTWSTVDQVTVLDAFLCLAYCSTMADPGMSIRQKQYPMILIRPSVNDTSVDAMTTQEFQQCINDDQFVSTNRSNTFNNYYNSVHFTYAWHKNFFSLFATCNNMNCRNHDYTNTIDPKVLNEVDHHFKNKATIIPWFWVEPTGLAAYHHQPCVTACVGKHGEDVVLPFIPNVTGMSKGYGYRQSARGPHHNSEITFELDGVTWRYCGFYYLYSGPYNKDDGLGCFRFCPFDRYGYERNVNNTMIYGKCESDARIAVIMWICGHSSIPVAVAAAIFGNSILINFTNYHSHMCFPKFEDIAATTVVLRLGTMEHGYSDLGEVGRTPRYMSKLTFNMLRSATGLHGVAGQSITFDPYDWSNVQAIDAQPRDDNFRTGDTPVMKISDNVTFRPTPTTRNTDKDLRKITGGNNIINFSRFAMDVEEPTHAPLQTAQNTIAAMAKRNLTQPTANIEQTKVQAAANVITQPVSFPIVETLRDSEVEFNTTSSVEPKSSCDFDIDTLRRIASDIVGKDAAEQLLSQLKNGHGTANTEDSLEEDAKHEYIKSGSEQALSTPKSTIKLAKRGRLGFIFDKDKDAVTKYVADSGDLEMAGSTVMGITRAFSSAIKDLLSAPGQDKTENFSARFPINIYNYFKPYLDRLPESERGQLYKYKELVNVRLNPKRSGIDVRRHAS